MPEPPKKKVHAGVSSYQSSTSSRARNTTPESFIQSNLVISQADTVDASGSTFNNIGRDQINVAINNNNYNGLPPSALNMLPYAIGSSWSPLLACLPGTRVALLEDIWNWIQAADHAQSAEIFLLSDFAGTGKSAIAHSVAKRSHDAGILASSFFFDRDVSERNGPQILFSSIARDLSTLSQSLSESINFTLENDRSLAWASPSRQFENLILNPSHLHRFDRPIVIVIDALDEGYTQELLDILCEEIPKLPGSFRIFLTSRPDDHIVTDLSDATHVKRRSIDIHGAANQSDIGVYCQNRLRYIASKKRLGAAWPGPQLSSEFQIKSEGLFIWASTVSEYLSSPKTFNPDSKFKSLLSNHNLSGLPAEAKMDELYAEILNTCEWNDEEFVEMYQLVVGTIMTLKTPLSASAIQALYCHKDPSLQVCEVLRLLSSLFIGSSDEKQPIRVLHLSFRDFITCRSRSMLGLERYWVDEKAHNQTLAFRCLLIMNDELSKDIPGTGYLSSYVLYGIEGIPEIADSSISESLWYACRFWSQHLIEIENPIPEDFLGALRDFLSTNLIRWMEISSSKGRFQGLADVRQWLRTASAKESGLLASTSGEDLAHSLHALSRCLQYMDRREDALTAIQEAAELYRQLAADYPEAFDLYLARALHDLSNRLGDVGRREDSLEVILEAVELYRRLAADRPNSDLALSLNNLSVRLANVGHHEKGLQAIQEAIELYRQLAADHPAVFNPDLARSLNTLSNRLAHLGHHEKSLQAIQGAVEIRRQLAADRPAVFNPDLAISLNNLSLCLADVGHQADSLQAIQEAVELYRQLAAYRPATFNPDLAMSLNNLSPYLANMGDREKSLLAIQEAIKLYRQLAADRPAVFNPDLASSLYNLSLRLADIGHQEDSLQVIQEAVELYRKLAVNLPMAFNAKLQEAIEVHEWIVAHNPNFT